MKKPYGWNGEVEKGEFDDAEEDDELVRKVSELQVDSKEKKDAK